MWACWPAGCLHLLLLYWVPAQIRWSSKKVGLSQGRYSVRHSREYWMMYRIPVFLAVVWFVFSPMHPLPLSPSTTSCWRKGGGGGTKEYNGKKDWSYLNHSILSAGRSLRRSRAIRIPERASWDNFNSVISVRSHAKKKNLQKTFLHF